MGLIFLTIKTSLTMSRMINTVLLLLVTFTSVDGMCPSQCDCLNRTVSCHGGSLSHVPHFLNPDTELLDVSGNQILKLESGLTYYPDLLSVNMSANSLRSLGRDQFISQSLLTSLDLSSNLVSKIRVGAFNGLESLVSLSMRSNRIERLGEAVFTGLVNLQYLDLSYNNISDIDPEAFKYLRNLHTLEIRRNSLAMVSDWTLPLRSLVTLDIAQNCLVQLSSSLSLSSLQELDVSDNMLVELSEETLDSLVELRRLDLSYNKLSAAPPVNNMAGLTELSLSGNMIKTLDESSLAGLRALQVLSLNNMPLLSSVSPMSLLSTPSLTSLSLSTCRRLSPLPPGLFSSTPLLASLDLSSVPWTQLSPDMLPVNPSQIILTGMPLKCDCSLLWLWELSEQGDIVQGASCDDTPLDQVDVDNLACDTLDWAIIIGCVGGIITVIILTVIIATLVKCCQERASRRGTKYLQCDYLQYNTAVMKGADDMLITTYLQPSPSHQIYAEIDKYPGAYPGPEAGDQIYYTVQEPGQQPHPLPHPLGSDQGHTLYSSSGSASSDQNTSSTECSIPLSTSSYCSPTTPRRMYHGSLEPHPLQPGMQHYPASTLQYNPAAFASPAVSLHYNTQGHRKRTLVQYKYPDVLPSDNVNQNYYV